MATSPNDRPGILNSSVEVELSAASRRDEVVAWLKKDFAPIVKGRSAVIQAVFESSDYDPSVIELTLKIKGRNLSDAYTTTTDVLSDIEAFVGKRSRDIITLEEGSRTLTQA